MNKSNDETITLTFDDAEALWAAFAPAGEEDILARAAFERELRDALGLQDEGLYFRPGGWTMNLPATAARVAVAAAVLAACFQIAGLEDLDREVIVAAAGLVASMDVRPVRLSRGERGLADRLQQANLADIPLTAGQARKALPKKLRRGVSADQIADALDRLVAAGLADRGVNDTWTLRAQGSEAWIRFSFADHTAG